MASIGCATSITQCISDVLNVLLTVSTKESICNDGTQIEMKKFNSNQMSQNLIAFLTFQYSRIRIIEEKGCLTSTRLQRKIE
jgi:hypothetical protein